MKTINLKNKTIFIVGETEFNKKYDLLNIKNDNSIILFESEYNNKNDIIINMIKYHNGYYEKKIHARKCKIQKIDNSQIKNEFLNKNHIQGTDKTNITYGAYFNDELLAVMCFTNERNMVSITSNKNEFELTRFAIKNQYIVAGIFNKMLNVFIDEYKPRKIISFADRRFSSKKNNIYLNNGFRLMKTLSPDYRYYNGKKLFHKFSFGKSSIKKKFPEIYDENKTESQMTNELGLICVWDCGKYKYELEFNENNKIIAGYIYAIINKINNKIYVGQTIRNLEKRKSEYKKNFIRNNLYNKYLQHSFQKYGWDNFEFKIIDTASTLKELNQKEIYYINKYNSRNRDIGYNIESGGRNAIPNDDTLKKMSKSHLGVKQSNEWIRKRVAEKGSNEAKKYGKEKTNEEKDLLSKNSAKYWLGKERDLKTKDKISQTKKLNGLSEKTKNAICKKVISYDPLTLEEIKEFDSTKEAGLFYNISQSTISRRCTGKTKNNGDIYFKY